MNEHEIAEGRALIAYRVFGPKVDPRNLGILGAIDASNTGDISKRGNEGIWINDILPKLDGKRKAVYYANLKFLIAPDIGFDDMDVGDALNFIMRAHECPADVMFRALVDTLKSEGGEG